VALFVTTAAGFVFFTRDTPLPYARRFNYTFEVGGGFDCRLRADDLIRVGYKFHHFSNGNSGLQNPGVDGEVITIGWVRATNLVLLVWDNSLYGTTGGQDTATAHGTDLAAAARAMGIAAAVTVNTAEELDAAMARTRTEAGPWVIVAKVHESSPAVKPPQDCVFIKQRFMAAIGVREGGTIGGPA
jgi:hypothetical protein